MQSLEILLTSGIACHRCGEKIFAITTPNGADCITCPLCRKLIAHSDDNMVKVNEDTYMTYCTNCKIIFGLGCDHAENGCTDNVYYAEFIGELTNNKTSIKMPIFGSHDEIKYVLEKTKYKHICMCKGKCQTDQCPEASYKNYPNMECQCKFNLSNTD